MKLEEEAYEEKNIGTIKRCSYRVMHHNDDYTLMMQFKPDKGEMGCEVQYVIWDKSGNRQVASTRQKARFAIGGPYSGYNRGYPIYRPAIYTLSPGHYYTLAGIANESFVLLELKVK